MISSTEAFLLLKKWKTEKSPMRFMFVSSECGGSFLGYVADIEGETLQLIGDGTATEFLVSLAEASFEYGDPREAPVTVKDKSEAKYLGCLSAILPSGDRLAFFELRITNKS